MTVRAASRFATRIALAIGLLIASIAVTSAGTAQQSHHAGSAQQVDPLPPNIEFSLPNGLSVSPLAIATVDTLPRTANTHDQDLLLMLALERIPFDWNETRDGRDPQAGDLESYGIFANEMAKGVQLLFVESGELTVITEEGDLLYRAGESVLLPEITPYALHNNTLECTYVLRLTAALIYPGGADVMAEEPTNSLPACGEPTLLVSTTSSPLFGGPTFTGDTQLSVLHVTLGTSISSDWGSYVAAHPGPVGYWIETGRAIMSHPQLTSPSPRLFSFDEVNLLLSAQSSISIAPYHEYGIATDEPLTMLMVGAIPLEEQFWILSS